MGVFTLRLRDEDHAALTAMAALTGTTMADLVRSAVTTLVVEFARSDLGHARLAQIQAEAMAAHDHLTRYAAEHDREGAPVGPMDPIQRRLDDEPCPACGGHQLLNVRRATARNGVLHLHGLRDGP